MYTCWISELATGKVNDKDILVLPLDTTKFDTHEDAMKTVLGHFNQVVSTGFKIIVLVHAK